MALDERLCKKVGILGGNLVDAYRDFGTCSDAEIYVGRDVNVLFSVLRHFPI